MLKLQDFGKRDVQTCSSYALSWWKSSDVTVEEKWQELWQEKTTKLWRVTILPTELRSHGPSAVALAARIGSARDFRVCAAALGQCKHKINGTIGICSSQSPSSHSQDQQWVFIQLTVWCSFVPMSGYQEPHWLRPCSVWSLGCQQKDQCY